MTIKPIFILLLVSLLTGAGCTLVHTIPLSAQEGDTIIVSTGSPIDMSKANVDLSYIPDNNNPATGTGAGVPIAIPDAKIRSIFNLYPDKNSAAWLYSNSVSIENESGHGPWTTVIIVDLPNDGSLWPTTGSLQVNTSAEYTGVIPSPNGSDIALEILPGMGSPSSFDYLVAGGLVFDSPLSELEPMKRLKFQPAYTGIDTTNTYGAVEIKIGIDKSGIDNDDFNIVVDDKIGTTKERNVHATWNVKRYETSIYFISPTGKLQYSDVSFSIISQDLQSQFVAGTQNVATDITINSVIWYDIDGAVANPPGPNIEIINLTGT